MKRTLFTLIITLFMLFQFTNLNGQNIVFKRMDKTDMRNMVTFDLATAKLCQEYISSVDIKEDRKNKSSFKKGQYGTSYNGCHICTELVRDPYENPMEVFLNIYLSDQRIFKNRRNPFVLKDIRKEYKEKYRDEFNQLLDSIDTENMVYYQNYVKVIDYIFEKNMLIFKINKPHMRQNNTFNYGKNTTFIPATQSTDKQLSGSVSNDGRNLYAKAEFIYVRPTMSEEDAQKFFDTKKPAKLYVKMHYALRLGEEKNGKPRYLQVVFKKIEVFYGDKQKRNNVFDPKIYTKENKLFELVFEEDILETKKTVQYQKVAFSKN